MKKLSFVIPCFNSESTISVVINDIINTVSDKDEYEIICINDNSTDNTETVLKNISQSDSNIKVISFSKNFGQHNALMCGFRHVSGNIIICLDDDGQTDPKLCYKLINELDENVDVVIAKYYNRHFGLIRNIGSYINKKMSEWLLDMPKNLVTNSYFVCKRYVVDEIVRYNNPYTFIGGLIIRTTNNIKNIEIEHKERISGKSGYSFIRLLSLWMNGFTAFSVKPLRLATFIGFIVSLIGFIYGLVLIILKLTDNSRLLGYSSLACIMLFIGGIIMIILGLIGEYIGRIYISLNNSPQYVIKSKVNFDED